MKVHPPRFPQLTKHGIILCASDLRQDALHPPGVDEMISVPHENDVCSLLAGDWEVCSAIVPFSSLLDENVKGALEDESQFPNLTCLSLHQDTSDEQYLGEAGERFKAIFARRKKLHWLSLEMFNDLRLFDLRSMSRTLSALPISGADVAAGDLQALMDLKNPIVLSMQSCKLPQPNAYFFEHFSSLHGLVLTGSSNAEINLPRIFENNPNIRSVWIEGAKVDGDVVAECRERFPKCSLFV